MMVKVQCGLLKIHNAWALLPGHCRLRMILNQRGRWDHERCLWREPVKQVDQACGFIGIWGEKKSPRLSTGCAMIVPEAMAVSRTKCIDVCLIFILCSFMHCAMAVRQVGKSVQFKTPFSNKLFYPLNVLQRI